VPGEPVGGDEAVGLDPPQDAGAAGWPWAVKGPHRHLVLLALCDDDRMGQDGRAVRLPGRIAIHPIPRGASTGLIGTIARSRLIAFRRRQHLGPVAMALPGADVGFLVPARADHPADRGIHEERNAADADKGP
jgi:hypothetical protein